MSGQTLRDFIAAHVVVGLADGWMEAHMGAFEEGVGIIERIDKRMGERVWKMTDAIIAAREPDKPHQRFPIRGAFDEDAPDSLRESARRIAELDKRIRQAKLTDTEHDADTRALRDEILHMRSLM